LAPEVTAPSASAEQFFPTSPETANNPSSDLGAPTASAEKSKVYESDAVKTDPSLKSGSNGKGWAVPVNPVRTESENDSSPTNLPKSDALPDLGVVKTQSERGLAQDSNSFATIPLTKNPSVTFPQSVPGEEILISPPASPSTVPLGNPFSPVTVASEDQNLKSSFPELGPSQPMVPSTPSLAPSLSIPSTPILSSEGVVRSGKPAPLFTVNTMDGTSFDLSSYKGKVVVLDFWRRTCGPCVKAMPKLAELRNTYPEEKLVVLGLNSDETRNEAESFLRQHPHKWRNVHCLSQRSNPLATYGVRLLPTFVVIDQVGNIQYQGHEIGVASSKVSELVSNPSIPNASYMAALR
jgi:thiol-disulfide isomerase/thioredoxin